MIQNEAVKQGCQQVLWLYGEEEEITEVGTMNLFIYWTNENGGKTWRLEMYGNTTNNIQKSKKKKIGFTLFYRERASNSTTRWHHPARSHPTVSAGPCQILGRYTKASKILVHISSHLGIFFWKMVLKNINPIDKTEPKLSKSNTFCLLFCVPGRV